MAAGEDTVPATRAAGTSMAMSFTQSHHGQVAALGQLAKAATGRCQVSEII